MSSIVLSNSRFVASIVSAPTLGEMLSIYLLYRDTSFVWTVSRLPNTVVDHHRLVTQIQGVGEFWYNRL